MTTEEMLKIERQKCFGGVCHALAQPIQSITGIVELMQYTDSHSDKAVYTQKLSIQVERVVKILRNLQKLANGEPCKIIPYGDIEIIDCK
ncbi:MAG: hypothetical protein ACFFDI_29640 [Promethearchaeota archaeon]